MTIDDVKGSPGPLFWGLTEFLFRHNAVVFVLKRKATMSTLHKNSSFLSMTSWWRHRYEKSKFLEFSLLKYDKISKILRNNVNSILNLLSEANIKRLIHLIPNMGSVLDCNGWYSHPSLKNLLVMNHWKRNNCFALPLKVVFLSNI